MKSFVSIVMFVLLNIVYCRNGWENVELRLERMAVQNKASKTTLVAYDKNQMSQEEIEAEMFRLAEKCECQVDNLDSVGVFVLTFNSTSHLGIDSLGLNTTKETGADDELLEIVNLPSPTDPSFRRQWALQELGNNADINIKEGWNEYLTDCKGKDPKGPSVIVAVIDTGVDYTHPELRNMMWTNPREIAGNGRDDDGNGIIDDVYGADFTGNIRGRGAPIDRHGHGTHCAGIIRGQENNGQGIAGVASFTNHKVKIMALKGLGDRGGGNAAGLLACLNYAIKNGATISSNSWGGGNVNSHLERVWDSVLRNNPNHLFVAAAGNSRMLISDSNRRFPCALNEPNLICVGSSTSRDTMSGFSNYGKKYVHVMAPGSSIYSTLPMNRYNSWSGTSMACPQVSGLAALMRSMRANLNGRTVRAMIEANVQKKTAYSSKVRSGGLIDVGATIRALKRSNRICPPPKTGSIFGCPNNKIALRSHHGKYFVAERNGRANVNRSWIQGWERWTVVGLGGNKIALKSAHGRYLVAERNHEVNANRSWIRSWETFTVLKQSNGQIALKTTHGRYVVAESNGRLRADRTWIRSWERFVPVNLV